MGNPAEETFGTGFHSVLRPSQDFPRQISSLAPLESSRPHSRGFQGRFFACGSSCPRPSQSRSKSGERGTVVPSKDYSHRRSPGALLFVKGEGPDGTHTQSKKKAYEN